MVKINEGMYQEILTLMDNGYSNTAISKLFGIASNTVSYIKHRDKNILKAKQKKGKQN